MRATATDSSGFCESVGTSVTILPGQPPSVTITPSNANPTVGEVVTFTANVSGATSTITKFVWEFGPGATPPRAETSGNRVTTTYSSVGSKTVTVSVIQATGPSGDGLTVVNVRATIR